MKSKINKLKPCPFCGGEVDKFTAPLKGTQMFVCKKCGADVCFYGAEYEPKATKAWNRRVDNGKL
jgi:Lar family restriction alleviation protein